MKFKTLEERLHALFIKSLTDMGHKVVESAWDINGIEYQQTPVCQKCGTKFSYDVLDKLEEQPLLCSEIVIREIIE